MLPPDRVGNVKSGASRPSSDELQLRPLLIRARTAIIKAAFTNQVFDILIAISVTYRYKPTEILQVTGQHHNSHANK
jgi:hypothetical protein